MVSMQAIKNAGKVASAGGKFVSSKVLKQYAGVAIDYGVIQQNVPGYEGRNSHKVHGTFTFFDVTGKQVGEIEDGVWEVGVWSKGGSIIDGLPPAPNFVMVKFTEKPGKGGKTFNQMDELAIADPQTYQAILANLSDEDEAPETDGPPEL